MAETITATDAQAFLHERGHDATDLEPLTGGLWSTTFAFREGGDEYVVRFHERRDDLEKDRFAERWRGGALRIPHMVEIGDRVGSGGYGIAERVRGGSIDALDEAGFRRILPALLAAMDAMREADVTTTRGYGLWHGDGAGEHASWRDAVLGTATGLDRMADRRAVLAGSDVAEGFDIGLARMRELLPFCPEARHAVHNDLVNYNVLADDAGVIVLDWGASIFGDFLYDAAVLTFWWPHFAERWGRIDIRAEIERHYEAIGLRVRSFDERLRCYELNIGVDAMAFEAGRDRWADARWTSARTIELARAAL